MILLTYTRPMDSDVTFDDPAAVAIPKAVAIVDQAIADHQAAIVDLADTRAGLIRRLAQECSVRGAADLLGVSPAAVSKAVARTLAAAEADGD